MSKIGPDARCARCGHTFEEHERMIASVKDYRHAREIDSTLAECLDDGGFVTEENYDQDHFLKIALRQ